MKTCEIYAQVHFLTEYFILSKIIYMNQKLFFIFQTFGIPNHHPKSQPFYDHVFTFSIQDNRIWFRNYQILSEDGSLAEIGPRFVLNPIRIFSGIFGGATLYQNPSYISPNEVSCLKLFFCLYL